MFKHLYTAKTAFLYEIGNRKSEINVENRTLLHGDNLKMLRGINSKSINLIATDPPFNKNKDFHATSDSMAAGASFQDRWDWDKDVHPEWVDQLIDDNPDVYHVIEGSRKSYGDDMGAFLCFMAVRLLEMRRVLCDDGSIYLHCDPTASHYLKELMDAIFGKDNFRNEIIWSYSGKGAKAISKQFPRNHDVILFYSMDINIKYQKQFLERIFTEQEARKKGFKIDTNDKWYKTSPRGDYTDESIERLKTENRIYITKNGTIRIKYFLKNKKKQIIEDVLIGDTWSDIPDAMHMGKMEKIGYPTQKPIALYERIINASSNEGDIVLDPFCGCATTCIAAEKLKRRWIGIDIWDKAHKVVIERLKKECFLDAPDKKRKDLIFTKGTVTYNNKTPIRTDGGDVAAPMLKPIVKSRMPERGPKMKRCEMLDFLIKQTGPVCQGCYLAAPDKRYLQLDHNLPRADGGSNDIYNRVLLCAPCNLLKSHRYTLSGLREQNVKQGHMKGESCKEAKFNDNDIREFLVNLSGQTRL